MHEQDGNTVICAVLWLACSGEAGPAVRPALTEGARLTYLIFDSRRRPEDGAKEYTFRLMVSA